jgi:mRNA degradation ribonuclease J1/J2
MTPDEHDLWFLPLGGTGEIGMNLNLYGHDGQWLMVDCGVTFPKPGRVSADGTVHHSGEPPVQMADPAFIADRRDRLAGLMIRTAAGNIFHSGDWKLDDQPLVGHGYSKSTFTALAEEGVAAMVCDSTNATVAGHSMSESALYTGLLESIRPAEGRVIVACFGSNIARLLTLAAVARATGRYMGLMGRSLISQLTAIGVDVLTAESSSLPIHASGHPAREELEAMYRWVQPSIAIPVHGEAEHMRAHADIARATGVPKRLVGRNGDLFMIRPVPGMRRQIVETGRLGWQKQALTRVF